MVWDKSAFRADLFYFQQIRLKVHYAGCKEYPFPLWGRKDWLR